MPASGQKRLRAGFTSERTGYSRLLKYKSHYILWDLYCGGRVIRHRCDRVTGSLRSKSGPQSRTEAKLSVFSYKGCFLSRGLAFLAKERQKCLLVPSKVEKKNLSQIEWILSTKIPTGRAISTLPRAPRERNPDMPWS